MLRPHVKAQPISLDALANEIGSYKPHLVISSKPKTAVPSKVPAWVELSLDHSRPTKVCVGEHSREYSVPLALETLLDIVDDVERSIQTQDNDLEHY